MLLRLCMFGLSMDEIESRRADSNRLPLLQLRVITQALQGCAGGCKHRIFRGVSFPCLAACCTVLRSRWYQSGIRTSDSYSLTMGPMARPRTPVRLHSKRPAHAPAGSTQPWQQHDASGLDDSWWDGRDDGRRGLHEPRSLRGLCRARPLTPKLEAGQVVIMDYLSAHKPARVRELIEPRGCELIYLPAYLPDLNPIEEAFAKVKDMLRQARARTKDALVSVLGKALSTVSAQDARGYFEHAGYRPQAQLL